MRTIWPLLNIFAIYQAAAFAQPCTPQWTSDGSIPGANSSVYALTVHSFNSIDPQRLVIGGGFTVVGSAIARSAAYWDGSGWHPLGTNARSINALTSFDPDGDGPLPPQLIAIGTFEPTISTSVYGVARWDGSQWQVLGSELNVPYALGAHCLASFDADGPGPLPSRLIAGGFSYAVPSSLHCVAQWDGEHWTTVGGGMTSPNTPVVNELTVFDPDGPGPQPAQLIAGGNFATAGGVPAASVASWDGAAWRPLSTGVSHSGSAGDIRTLAAFDPDGPGPALAELIAGGLIDLAGGVNVKGIAAWNGSSWRDLGGGLSASSNTGTVTSIAVFSPNTATPARLIATGSFSTAGTTPVWNIASWDGSTWSALGSGLRTNGAVALSAKLRVVDTDGPGPAIPAVIAAGNIADAGGSPVSNLAAWDGDDWHPMGTGFTGAIHALIPRRLASGQSEIIAAGTFRRQGDISLIARYDGATWAPLGQGVGGSQLQISALATFDPTGSGSEKLIVGGWFFTAGGIPANNIALWDDDGWHALGSNLYGPVTAIAVFDFDGPGPNPKQIVAGNGYSVQRWDGTQWSQVGGVFSLTWPNDDPATCALKALDPDGPGPEPVQLFVGGHFHRIDTANINGLARWDGTAWRPLGAGGDCYAITTFDPDGPGPTLLCVGGRVGVGSGPQHGGASFDGQSWQSIFPPILPVRTFLTVSPRVAGGLGQQLIAAGGNSSTPYYQLNGRLASWDGINPTWQLLAGGVNQNVFALATFPSTQPQLLIGGDFTSVGEVAASAAFARLACLPYPCYPNCDQSTTPPTLNFSDFQCFLNKFATGAPYANCDGSTFNPILNINDFNCFLNSFAAGCP